jgi:hypothetical protein
MTKEGQPRAFKLSEVCNPDCSGNKKIWQDYLNHTVRSTSETPIVLLDPFHDRSDFWFITQQGSNFRRYKQSYGSTAKRTIRWPKDGSM